MTPPGLRAMSPDGGSGPGARSAGVARIGSTGRKGSTVPVDAGVPSDAETFGVLTADTIGHAARAHAAAPEITEDQADALILRGVDKARVTPDPQAVADTNPDGRLN